MIRRSTELVGKCIPDQNGAGIATRGISRRIPLLQLAWATICLVAIVHQSVDCIPVTRGDSGQQFLQGAIVTGVAPVDARVQRSIPLNQARSQDYDVFDSGFGGDDEDEPNPEDIERSPSNQARSPPARGARYGAGAPASGPESAHNDAQGQNGEAPAPAPPVLSFTNAQGPKGSVPKPLLASGHPGSPWADDTVPAEDFFPARAREASLGILHANATHEAPQRAPVLTVPFYKEHTNLLLNFSGTLLPPLWGSQGPAKNATPVYLEDVLGALLNDASRRAGTRTGARDKAVSTINRSILGAATTGSGEEVMYDVLGVTPGTIYSFTIDAAAAGVATAGVAFYDSTWRPLQAPSFKVSGRAVETYAISMIAPEGAQLALVFAGTVPSKAVPDGHAKLLGIRKAAFGPVVTGPVYVDYHNVIRTVPPNAVGLNTNYMLDGPLRSGSGPGLTNTLKDIGLRALRYPGGEKADGMYWNGQPDNRFPQPQPSRRSDSDWPYNDPTIYSQSNSSWVDEPMKFDEFLELSDALAADPFVVLNYDSANKQDGGKSATMEQLKQAALEWVKYALQQKKRVKFWEFSNESYFKAYNGYATAMQYGNDLVTWARMLRQVDPDLRIGANGPSNKNGVSEVDSYNQKWWPYVLQTAGSSIDFVICHSYPVTGWNYDFYQHNSLNFQNDVQEINGAIETWASVSDKDRLRIAVTEFGVLDFQGVWQNARADLGHALVNFDLLATLLSHPRVDSALFWNTRWRARGQENGPSHPGSPVYLVYDDNTPTAMGAVIKVFANFFPGSTLVAAGSTQTVRTWAMLPGPGSAWSLTVVLLNKGSSPINQQVILNNYVGNTIGRAGQFGGTTEDDPSPQWVLLPKGPIINNTAFTMTLSPYSITVVTF